MKIVQEIVNEMKISQPQKKFIKEIFPTLLGLHGKANFTNMSRYTKLSERSIRRNYQKAFDFNSLNQQLSERSQSKIRLLAGDCTFIKKSGKHTFGLAHFFNSSTQRAEKGLEVSLISLIDSDKQAFALSASQTPPDEDESRLSFYLEQLRQSKPYWPKDLTHGAFDGYYTKEPFVSGLCDDLGLDMIGKLRKDANLRYLYQGPVSTKPGRPKVYDGKVDYADLSRFESLGEVEKNIFVYHQKVWHMSLMRTIRAVVLVQQLDSGKTTHRILFSTDTKLEPLKIIQYYQSRFQIEFLFRDAKQFTGLEDCQARNQQALHFHFNLSFSALNVAKSESLKRKDKVFSMQSFKCRYFNQRLMETIFSKLDLDQTLIKLKPAYEELCNYGAIAS